METRKEHSPARSYLTALLAPAIVAGVMQLTWPFFEGDPLALFFLAVMCSAWYGGLVPGLLAMLISFLLADYFFIAPYFSVWPPGHRYSMHLVTLATVGLFISVLSELMHRQRRRAEISLDISEHAQEDRSRLAAIVESSDDAIISKTIEGIITSWNQGAEQIFGYPEQEAIGRSISILLPPNSADEPPTILEKIKRGEPVEHYETERVRKDGRIISVSLTVSPIRNADGIVIGASAIARDITDRKRAEDDLRKQKEILQTIFDRIPVMLSSYDQDNNITLMNREWESTRGWSKQEIQNKNIDVLAQAYPDPQELQRARAFFAEASGEWADFRMRLKDGRVLDTSWAAVRLSDGMKINIGQDISEQKQNEARLREYEKVVEKLEEMIAVVDQDYRYLIANRAFLKYRGLRREQVVGHLVAEVLDQELFEKEIKSNLDRCLQGEIVKYEMKYSYPGLGERDLFISYFPIEGPHGIDRVASVMVDRTEAKRAEEALARAEQKYRNIFENADEGIFQSTPEGQCIEANPALARMFGFDSPAELIRDLKNISSEVYVDPTRRELFKHLIEAQGFVREFEHQILHRDGSKIWVSVNARAVRDEQGAILYYEGTTQDINARRLAEARSAAFATLARKLSGAATKLGAARIIAETASELFRLDSCNLDLYDADRDVVHPLLKIDTIEGRLIDFTSSGSDRKPTGRNRRVIDHGPELLLREDPSQFDKDAIPFGNKLRPSASLMAVPIRHAARVVGLLSIQSYTPRAYDAAALDDLQSLADHCGEALNRIHAEESFYESEERFRQMAHHFEDVVWLTDKDISQILYINPAYEKTFRRTSESVHERLESFLDKIHPEDRNSVERVLERQRKGDHQPVEYRIVWPDGSIRWILRRTFPIRNTEGEICLIGGIAQDITERKRAEESLKLFRNLIDQSSDAIEVIDPVTLRFVDCNESAHRSLGYSREEFLALTVFDIDPLANRSLISRHDEEMKETGFATIESVHRRKDGTTFPVEVNVKLVKLEKVYRLAVVRDITGRERAEKALRESEERYRELFENAKDAIYVHDLSGRYVSVNRAAEQLTGFTREEILGKHYSNFVAPSNLKHTRTNLCKKLDEENETIYEVFLITKDRQAVPVEVSSRLIHENGVAVGVQGIVRDITERKRAQEALQTYSRRLIDAQEAERQHIARELHDEIGQVLTAVKINLQSIQRLNPDSAWMPPLDESIGIVDEALGRVRELSIELRPSLLDDLGLSAALRWYVDRYAQRTGIIAEVVNGFEEDSRLPRELETACFRIAQEALTNIARHAQAARVSVHLERSRERVLLTITDDGVGFDVESLFHSASAVAALGLRGMEERALAVSGKIEIDSGLKRGTRIRATLPLKRRK